MTRPEIAVDPFATFAFLTPLNHAAVTPVRIGQEPSYEE
jgi:hypothetical protein